MLIIRLARTGRVNLPSYRIVVQEKTRSPKSLVIETIGNYDPKVEPAKVIANKERLDHWLKAGARPTVRVAELLVKQDMLKIEQAPELALERKRRESAKTRVKAKADWKKKVEELKKKRAEAKEKAKAAPKAEAKPAEAPAEKPAEAPKQEAAPKAEPEKKA